MTASIHALWDSIGLFALCFVLSLVAVQALMVIRQLIRAKRFRPAGWGRDIWPSTGEVGMWYAVIFAIGAALGAVVWVLSFFERTQ
jgi:hypothetical protein